MIEAFEKSSTGNRRELFRSIGIVALGTGSAAVLGACSGPEAGNGAGNGSGGGGASAPASGGPQTIAKADVPQGGGVIRGGFVVTQPNAGEFKAFSSTCTHKGCPVSEIAGGSINCNCHGSKFSIADGSVVNGPAEKPLGAATVTASGDNLEVAAS
jgi:Rieske Fe-S protein